MSKAKLILGGLKSFLPRRHSYSMASHPVDVRYGYSVWLRHLATLAKYGQAGPYASVVELGPGNSLATGITAILAGAESYTGLDVLRHATFSPGDAVLDELNLMFQSRAPIPHDGRYARLRPSLEDYAFPSAVAKQAKADDRRTIARLRADIESLATGSQGGATLRYIVPWGPASVRPGSVDLVVSQAVLQEMPNGRERSALRDAIAATASWLRPGGVASHQIDLGMYGLEPWNIHWSWSDAVWKMVRGRRENFVNREPLSTYLSLFRQAGFSIIAAETEQERGVDDVSLNRRFRALDRAEREARSVLLIVQKSY